MKAAAVKHKRDPGRCYLRAGFVRPPCPHCGGFDAGARCEVCVDGRARTKSGLLVLQMWPGAMPAPEPAVGTQAELWSA